MAADIVSQKLSLRDTEERRKARIEDYLIDKVQTSADLASIDSLLEDIHNRQSLLRHQLKDARTKLVETVLTSKNYARVLQERAHNFRNNQADIDRRLLIVTQSETSDDAVKNFGESLNCLQRLDVAKGYIELLSEVELLSLESRANFKHSPQYALKPFLRLQGLMNALKEAQPAAEDAAPHLVDHVIHSCHVLWKQMKNAFSSDFEVTLKKMEWPQKSVTFGEPLKQEWANGVKKLLELQESELKAHENSQLSSYSQPLVLLPLEVMVKPLELRFKYHFEGERPTNKIDKPEYFLSHIINLLNTYDEFFAVYFQPIIRDFFRTSNLALSSVYVDSTSAFITAILPMLRHKISAILPDITDKPQLLSHLIHELISFDTSLRDEWSYDGGNSIDTWKGLTREVLVERSCFPRWLSVEKNFALTRYKNIVEAPESFEIDFDSLDAKATKPTHAAIRVHDLLETITDRYRPLTSFSQKVQFLIDIQIEIFDLFHTRLRDSLSAYQTLTSSIGRNIQGASRETQAELEGIGGLERLCRIYGSAEYLENKMRDWSDDVFFLELWDELRDRARRNTGEKSLAGAMSVEHIAQRTSNTVGSEEDTGALFDETAGAYRQLRMQTEDAIHNKLTANLRNALRPYGRINPWSSLSSIDTVSSLALTAELDAIIQLLDEYLQFLTKVLSQAPLRRIVRQAALALQTFLWENVLMRYTFSAPGVAQYTCDVEILWETIDRWVSEGQGESGMQRLKEALILLNLPEDINDENSNSGDVFSMNLWEAEKRIFHSNEDAREALEELNLKLLSASDARKVLERRIELSNR